MAEEATKVLPTPSSGQGLLSTWRKPQLNCQCWKGLVQREGNGEWRWERPGL